MRAFDAHIRLNLAVGEEGGEVRNLHVAGVESREKEFLEEEGEFVTQEDIQICISFMTQGMLSKHRRAHHNDVGSLDLVKESHRFTCVQN